MQKMTKKNLAIRLHKSKGHNLGQDTIHNWPNIAEITWLASLKESVRITNKG